MYLRKLEIQNVKLLRDVKIDFTDASGAPRMWTVFVGENRSCKTTLLQTIAAAASGRDKAIHLTTDVIASWPDLRRPAAPVAIQAEFGFSEARHAHRTYPGPWGRLATDRPEHPPHLRSFLSLEPERSVFDGAADYLERGDLDRDPLLVARRENLADWFVAGYGVRRMLRGVGTVDISRQRDPSLDRLKPLFGEDLIGTNFIELLGEDIGRGFAKILQKVFVAGGLLPHVTAFELRGRGGITTTRNLVEAQRFEMDIPDDQGDRIRVPAAWLSQGYQSIIGWLADMVGQIVLEAGEAVDAADMEGCVLVDEIDMYLHPTWQLRLIPALKRVFPRLQFIVTTHSPMVLPALEADEVWLLSHDRDRSVVATRSSQSPAMLTGSELLDTFFSIQQLYPSPVGAKANEYARLATDSTRDEAGEIRMKELRRELASHGVEYDWEPVPREVLE
jgi:hypothetical protein